VLVFMLGLVFLVPIEIITRLPFWSQINTGLNQETVDYMHWWLNIFPEPAAGFLAIYAAFELEKRSDRRNFQQRVREIVPYLYFELSENKALIENFRKNQFEFINDGKTFNHSSWDMFKDDIKKWQEQNVVPLTRIYYCLSFMNRKIENDALYPDDPTITSRIIATYNLIINQLKTYDENYFDDEKNFEELTNVYKIFFETSLMDKDLQKITLAELDSERLKLVMKDRIQDILIRQIAESPNYATANKNINQLNENGDLSNNQINELLFWYLDNDQVSGSSEGHQILLPLFIEKQDELNTSLASFLESFIENDYTPTHRIHLFGMIKNKITSEKSELTEEELSRMIQKEIETNRSHTYEAIEKIIKELEVDISIQDIWKNIIT